MCMQYVVELFYFSLKYSISALYDVMNYTIVGVKHYSYLYLQTIIKVAMYVAK